MRRRTAGGIRQLGWDALASWGVTPSMCVKTGYHKLFYSMQRRQSCVFTVWSFRLTPADARAFASGRHPNFNKAYATLKLKKRRVI